MSHLPQYSSFSYVRVCCCAVCTSRYVVHAGISLLLLLLLHLLLSPHHMSATYTVLLLLLLLLLLYLSPTSSLPPPPLNVAVWRKGRRDEEAHWGSPPPLPKNCSPGIAMTSSQAGVELVQLQELDRCCCFLFFCVRVPNHCFAFGCRGRGRCARHSTRHRSKHHCVANTAIVLDTVFLFSDGNYISSSSSLLLLLLLNWGKEGKTRFTHRQTSTQRPSPLKWQSSLHCLLRPLSFSSSSSSSSLRARIRPIHPSSLYTSGPQNSQSNFLLLIRTRDTVLLPGGQKPAGATFGPTACRLRGRHFSLPPLPRPRGPGGLFRQRRALLLPSSFACA